MIIIGLICIVSVSAVFERQIILKSLYYFMSVKNEGTGCVSVDAASVPSHKNLDKFLMSSEVCRLHPMYAMWGCKQLISCVYINRWELLLADVHRVESCTGWSRAQFHDSCGITEWFVRIVW